jgi:hypothetical protein
MPRDKQLSGQSSIMEYLLISFFVLMVILFMIFFLTGWFFSQQGLEQQNIQNQRVLTMLERVTNSQLFVNENSVFDDLKLLSAQSMPQEELCSDLSRLFGDGWFLRIEVINRPGGPCDFSSYVSGCGSWELRCGEPGEGQRIMNLPVNVFRKAEDRTDIGVLTVGVYT